jgi:hypothetical protein
MSKLNTLKTQNPDLNISLIDALGLVYKTKYVEMYLNIYKTKKAKKDDNDDEDNMTSFQIEMIDMGFNEKYVNELNKKLNHLQQHFVSELISEMNYRDIRSFNKFIELNERGLIDNKDVTSYKSMEDVLSQISIAELKLIDKELEKLVLKLHEDEEWLIIKPLTYESSKKYGAGTRWCTAAESEDYQFYNYTSRGILIYTINKKTGYKVATFKNLDKEHSRELSFWDAEDNRVDSLELNLPDDVMDIIVTDLKNCQQSNYHLAPDEIKAINDNAKGEKKSASLLRTLGELMSEHNIPRVSYDIRDNGEYTTTATDNTLNYTLNYEEPQQG